LELTISLPTEKSSVFSKKSTTSKKNMPRNACSTISITKSLPAITYSSTNTRLNMLSKEDELDLLSEEDELSDPTSTKSIYKDIPRIKDDNSILIPEGDIHKMSVTQKIDLDRYTDSTSQLEDLIMMATILSYTS
jgi:hypothetical protein